MEKGNIGVIVAGVAMVAVILLVLLSNLTEPMTKYTDSDSSLMNITGQGYTSPPVAQFDTIHIFNDTNCTTNELTEGTDYVVDTPYNGQLNGAVAQGGNVEFTDGDSMVVPLTSDKADLNNNLTIIGVVKEIK